MQPEESFSKKIIAFYPVWGALLAMIVGTLWREAFTATFAAIAIVFILLTYIIFRKIPIAEFFVRYWGLTLVALLVLITPWRHLLILYLVTYTGFVYGKKIAKKSSTFSNIESIFPMITLALVASTIAIFIMTDPAKRTGFAINLFTPAVFLTCIFLGIFMAVLKYPHPGFCKEHPLIINGRIYAQHVTGVQRYGIEIIKQIDKMVEPGEVILALPHGDLQTQPKLQNIELAYIGKGNGNKWTQFHLPIFAYRKKGIILTLAAVAPAVKTDFVATHDISFMRYPDSYGRSFRIMYAIGYFLTLYRCKGIITISKFSKNELINFYSLDEDRFTIAGNSAEQLLEVPYKEQSLSKWGIGEDEQYYLSVGSKNLHKNQIFIKKLAQKYPDRKFVVAGGSSERSFGTSGDLTTADNRITADAENTKDSRRTADTENTKDSRRTADTENTKDNKNTDPSNTSTNIEGIPQNLIITGYITDDEVRTLYAHAHAFIFPSLYEGFGIPPLEAILMGVKHVAVSDIPVLREIYPKGCYFFDPRDASSFDITKLDSNDSIITDEIREYYLNKHSWKNSAAKILDLIR